MRSNALAWNPMEAFHFTVANEDHNLYTFDMRRLDRALRIHKDFVSAGMADNPVFERVLTLNYLVMDVDYSPTGAEFVAGGFDRTLRIFRASEGHSRLVIL